MTKNELEKEMLQLKQEMKIREKEISRYGLFRLFSLFGFLLLMIAGMTEKNGMLTLLSLPFLLIFMRVAYLQDQSKIIFEHEKALNIFDQAIMDRKNGHWHQEQPMDQTKQKHYIFDLDVLGKDSLYHYLDFCSLQTSKQALKERLSKPLKTENEIISMQQALLELSKSKVAKQYLIEERLIPSKQRICLRQADLEKPADLPFYLKVWCVIYPLSMVGLISFSLWKEVLLVMIFGLGLSFFHFRYWQEASKKAAIQVSASDHLNHLAKQFIQPSFNSPLLSLKQAEIMNHLSQRKTISWVDQLFRFRANPLLLLMLDGLFFYDGWLYLWFEKQPDASYLLALEQALGDVGALCSLTVWFEIKERTVFPNVSKKLQAKDLKHPLMESEKAVGQNFGFNPGAVVITGSNMAGKTTFMRTIGLNLVLFYCGLSIDADYFEAPLLEIYTSMRVRDEVQTGVSSFYGELIRIKEMIEASKQEKQAIFLIDEIFKGTNLKDRIIGAKAVIEKLGQNGAFLFVSTHDEELCHHENIAITNVHFEEYYQDGKIYFDYQLKPGMSKTTNAKYLMQMIGLLE